MAAEEKNKIKEIVDILKKDGVEAGKSKADQIISDANKEADQIKKNAQKEKENIIEQARKEADKLKSSAEANVRMAISQGLNKFRESIENSLLSPTVLESLNKSMDGSTIKEIILTVVKAYSEQGFSTNDLKIILGEKEKEDIKSTIIKELDSKIKDAKSIEISDEIIPAGVKLVQKQGNLSLEFTPESIKEVMLAYIRPEFRKLFFEKDKNSKGE
jgi:V/A-type H+-transporting ATPase subunit E